MTSPKGSATWWGSFFISTVLMVALPSNGCEKTAWEVSLGTHRDDSKLTEYASEGKILVTEHGSLTGTEARAEIFCDSWSAGLKFDSDGGDHNYAGQTSLGSTLKTKSRIDNRKVGASLYWRYTESLQFGMDMAQQHSTRTIAGTTIAKGYPEIYDRFMTRVGPRWTVLSNFGQWTIAGLVSVHGLQTMSLQLPGNDTTALKFDSPKQWELAIRWRNHLSEHLFMDATFRYINTEIGQSNYGIVTSNGVPVGIAYQPKMTVVDLPLSVAIGVLF